MSASRAGKASHYLVAATALLLLFEFYWFGRNSLREIDYDGMAYIGIARHLRQADFRSAINAFRSPLLSWIIALIPGRDYVLTGKAVNVLAFFACAMLLYLFTLRLWRSPLAASVAILLFVLARGLVPAAVGSVVPDLLFTALTLAYFIVLLHCLREACLREACLGEVRSRGAGWRRWFLLGMVHGLAYLAKAFALPWLALSTVVAALLSPGTVKQRLRRLAAAALIPVVVAVGWAAVLHSKYGVFTTGSQFKANLLQWTLREYPHHREPSYALLRDTTKEVDDYVVDDPMPPGSWPWSYRVSLRQALPKLIAAEERNVPAVLKEILIVITPGGLLAFAVAAAIVTRRRRQYPAEWRIVAVIAVSSISLVFAYSMLVFDARYLYPLIPLLLAVAARFLIPTRFPLNDDWNHANWRMAAIVLLVAGEIAALVYSSSPFRTLNRDFQVSCYDAAHRLKAHEGTSLISIGAGPFPEHGVGWEASYKAAFFGNGRLIAALDDLPTPGDTPVALADLAKASPDAVIIWGNRNDVRYRAFMQFLSLRYPNAPSEEISDPVLGNVGAILFLKEQSTQPTP
ncbi:MAG: hypothetical protein WAL71_02360 [Terriglobales bacterium]|jgi:hypothetical protein